jgi:hypothetical protein
VGSGAKAKFSFVSSLEQAKDSARSIGIKDVVYGASDTRTQWRDFERLFGEPLDAQDAIDLSNRILPEAYDLKNRFPDIPLYGIDELWLRGGGRGRAIHGWSNDRVLMTGTDKLWDNDAIQRVKSWEKTNGRRWASMSIDNYENIIGSTFRHELGHILTTEKNAKKLVKIMEQENIDLDWFRENVSEYAGTNHHEAFAETFALYTSRNYEKGSLPKSIEDLMEDSLQGRVGEFGTESGDPFSSTVGQSVIPPESDDSKLAEDDNEFPSAVERDVKIIS